MQISQIKKLLHPIKGLMSRRAKKSLAETSEPREVSEMQNAESRMQNEESRMQGTEAEYESIINPSDDAILEDMADEAYAKSSEPYEKPLQPPSSTASNKAHLTSSVPRVAKVPKGALTKGEMAEIRKIFGDMDDAEIQRLYKRVTNQ